jgi:hypothetical protein
VTLYCLDSSVFINSWTKHYPKDVFPGVWDCFHGLMAADQAIIPHDILEEIKRGGDELYGWVDWHAANSIIKPDERHIRACKAIVQAHRRLLETKKNRSGSGADPWLIAHAQVAAAIVVTEERASNQIDKPKIPDVCSAMSIECISTVELLRRCAFRAVQETT